MVGTDALEDGMVSWRLGLDGGVKPVSGVLSLAAMAGEKGNREMFPAIGKCGEGGPGDGG
ncbi:MAG: hypothetical protein ACLR0U_01410 [Enterocloster clostridioformis]